MAAELGAGAPEALRAICAVCAALDLSSCVNATDSFRNILYRRYFVRKLKRRFREKLALFPDRYADPGLNRVHTIRDFDDIVTAPNCGYLSAADYYDRASAMRAITDIRVPTLLLSAEDDPMVPPRTFADPSIQENPNFSVVISKHGGHCAFLSADADERHWAEARVVEFCAERSKLIPPRGPHSSSAHRKAKEF